MRWHVPAIGWDAVLALGAVMLALADLSSLSGTGIERLPGALALTVLGLSLLIRRRAPDVLVYALVAVVAVPDDWLSSMTEVAAFLVVIVAVIYSAAVYTSGLRRLAAGTGVVALAVLGSSDAAASPVDPGEIAFFAVLAGGPWVAGRAIALGRQREAALKGEREQRARAAVAEERARIARDMHDTVAHAISVVVLQARGGRRVLDGDVGAARAAFNAIEQVGAEALSEMRRLLGLLGSGSPGEGTEQIGLRSLSALADSVRAAGLPVDVVVEGAGRHVPPGVDISAYRIIQEALTNSLKHAGRAQVRVVVRYGVDELHLKVADNGRGARSVNGNGHGLVGMRERAMLVGGDVEVDQPNEGGFVVRARLPLREPSG